MINLKWMNLIISKFPIQLTSYFILNYKVTYQTEYINSYMKCAMSAFSVTFSFKNT